MTEIEKVLSKEYPPIKVSLSNQDAILFALGINMGQESQL
jgi:hypothetical protein